MSWKLKYYLRWIGFCSVVTIICLVVSAPWWIPFAIVLSLSVPVVMIVKRRIEAEDEASYAKRKKEVLATLTEEEKAGMTDDELDFFVRVYRVVKRC